MSYETDDKMVSHPDHYQSGKYEVIDIIEEFTKDLSGIEAVDTANAIKYVLRWHKKNGKQDVKKAIWYLTHLAEHLEEKENPSKPHSIAIHGDRVKFKTNGGRYNSGIVKDIDKDSCLIEVDKLGCEPPKDVHISLPYYVRILLDDEIVEQDE